MKRAPTNIMNGRQKREALASANRLLEEISKSHDIDMRSLRSRVMYPHFVAARREFCKKGRELRIQVNILAETLDRDYSTIVYHSNERYRRVKNAQIHKRRGAHANA